MEQWRIDSSGISKHDSQEQELFLYQHMRTQNGKIFYLKEHLQILNNSSLDLFDKPISLTEKTVCNACEELLYRGGYSSQAIHIVELRVWQSGKFAMRVIETSLYKGFALRVMRPKATVIEHCNYPFSQPTSAAIAMTDFLRLMALKNQCQVAICTDKNMVITAVDGATPIVVHGTAITISNSVISVYSNIVISALKKLPNHTVTIRPITLTEALSADELFYVDSRGITAVGSLNSTHYSDSIAYAAAKNIAF